MPRSKMRRVDRLLAAAGMAMLLTSAAVAEEPGRRRPAAPAPVVGPAYRTFEPAPLRYVPWSRDAEIRARQAIDRQLAVLDYTRWHASGLWAQGYLYGSPWYGGGGIWGLPYYGGVEQPVGRRVVYDRPGGYTSLPIYADELRPPAGVAAPLAPPPVPLARQPRRLYSW